MYGRNAAAFLALCHVSPLCHLLRRGWQGAGPLPYHGFEPSCCLVVFDNRYNRRAKYNKNVVSVSQRTAVRTRFFSQKHEVVLGALSLVEDIN